MSIQYRIEDSTFTKPIRESGSKYDPIFEQLRPGQRVIVPIAFLEKISQALRKFLERKGFQAAGAVKTDKKPCDLDGTRLVGEGAIYLLHEKPIQTQGADKPATTFAPVPMPAGDVTPDDPFGQRGYVMFQAKPPAPPNTRSPWPTVAPKAKPATKKKV